MPRYWISFLSGSLLMLSSCSLQYVPKEQTIEPARIPAFKPVGTISLTNTQSSAEEVQIAVSPYTVSLSYKSYTDLALKLLRNEIDKRKVSAAGGAAKEIKLAIVDIKMLPMAGNFRCILNYTVETGEGYIRGLESVGASWNFQTAIDSAVANVAVGILNEEPMLTYLEK